MSFLDDLFGSSGGDWEAIPSTKQQKRLRTTAENLATSNVTIPAQKIVGLSEREKAAMNLLDTYLKSGPNAGLTTAVNTLTKSAQGMDPTTSPEYLGYREASKMEEEEAINALNRSLTLKGHGGYSTPGLNELGKTRRGYSADRTQMLGGLMNQEMDRRNTAAVNLAGVSEMQATEPVRKAEAATTIGALPRQMEQAQEDAQYQALLQTLLFPYTTQYPIINNLINEQRYAYQPGTQSGLGNLIGTAGSAFLSSPAGSQAAVSGIKGAGSALASLAGFLL